MALVLDHLYKELRADDSLEALEEPSLRDRLHSMYPVAHQKSEGSHNPSGTNWDRGCIAGVLTTHIETNMAFSDIDISINELCSTVLDECGVQIKRERRSGFRCIEASRRGMCKHCHSLVETSHALMVEVDTEIANGFVIGNYGAQQKAHAFWISKTRVEFERGAKRRSVVAGDAVARLIFTEIARRGDLAPALGAKRTQKDRSSSREPKSRKASPSRAMSSSKAQEALGSSSKGKQNGPHHVPPPRPAAAPRFVAPVVALRPRSLLAQSLVAPIGAGAAPKPRPWGNQLGHNGQSPPTIPPTDHKGGGGVPRRNQKRRAK